MSKLLTPARLAFLRAAAETPPDEWISGLPPDAPYPEMTEHYEARFTAIGMVYHRLTEAGRRVVENAHAAASRSAGRGKPDAQNQHTAGSDSEPSSVRQR